MKKINLQILLIAVALASVAPICAMLSRAVLEARKRAAMVGTAAGARVVSSRFTQIRVPINTPKITVSSPFAWGGQARAYSNYLAIKGPGEQNVPTFGWRSMVPGTTEYQAKRVVNLIDQLIQEMQQKGVTSDNLDRYKKLQFQYAKLVPAGNYNPIKDQSLLLLNAAKRYVRKEASENSQFYESDIVKQLYNLGIRLSEAEVDDLLVTTGWGNYLRQLADGIDKIVYSDKLTLEDVGECASRIISSYRLFQSFGIDIMSYFNRPMNMEAMAWLSSEWLYIKNESNRLASTGVTSNGKAQWVDARLDTQPLSYLRSNVIHPGHQSRIVYPERSSVLAYPIGAGREGYESNRVAPLLKTIRKTNFVDTFLAKAKDAGFFKPAGGLVPTNLIKPVGLARTNLIKILNISEVSSPQEIKKAYYDFAKKAHSDVTQDITGPLYMKLQREVNPAWDAYSKELAKVAAAEERQQHATE